MTYRQGKDRDCREVTMKAATPKANITQRQADAAVKAYLRTKPYTEAGIRRVPCSRCGSPSGRQWSLRPCAIGKTGWYGLCVACDEDLNALVMEFLNVPDREARMKVYRAGG